MPVLLLKKLNKEKKYLFSKTETWHILTQPTLSNTIKEYFTPILLRVKLQQYFAGVENLLDLKTQNNTF